MANVYDFRTYADESGLHGCPIYCLIAGYFGKPASWLRFERRWERVLKKHDVADFHSKDYFAFKPGGQRAGKYRRLSSGEEARYGDWSEDRHTCFFDGLLEVIKQRDVQPLGFAIEIDAWDKLTYGERRFLSGGHIDRGGVKWLSSGAPDQPYFLPFQEFITHAAQRAGPERRVYFTFDDHQTYKARALQLFNEVTQLAPAEIAQSLGGIGFMQRRDAPGLQAADLYTHCWHRYLTEPSNIGEARAKAMDVLTAQDPEMGVIYARGLEVLLSQLPADISAMLRTHRKQGSREK